MDSEVFCDSLEQLEPEMVRQPLVLSLLHPTVSWLLPLPPLDLLTHFSRFGESRGAHLEESRAPLEESLTPETVPCLPQRKVRLLLNPSPSFALPHASGAPGLSLAALMGQR